MTVRAWIIGACSIATLAAPPAALADLTVAASAKASSYATGPITSKEWSANIAGGTLKAIVFSQPITPQFQYAALQDALTAPTNVACDAGHLGLCLGTVNVVLVGTLSRSSLKLPFGVGACPTGAGKKVAPAPAHDVDYADTGEWAIDTSGVSGLVNDFTCFGARVDANPPGLGHPEGEFKLSVDITPAANAAASLGSITYAAVLLNNLSLTHGSLFADNPTTPVSVDTAITVTPCVAGTVPCESAGPTGTGIVTEVLGGATGVSAVASAEPVLVGTTAHVTGVVTRGTDPSSGDTVTVTSGSSVLGTTTAGIDGSYDIAFTLPSTKVVTIGAARAGQATLERTLTMTLACPVPKLSGKVKVTKTGKTYTVTFKIKAVKGVTYKATVGSKTLKQKRLGTTVISFTGTGLKLKKGAKALVAASRLGTSPASARIKLL